MAASTTAHVVSDNPLVSIVIPARNEAEDIAHVLEACLALEHEPKEVIVVDDSTDETPRIVAGYAHRGVRLIHREVSSNGCCGARNLGMQGATGEIVVLLNADAPPRPDFVSRLLPHYRSGADYVIVKSRVLNTGTIWGRFAEAMAKAAPASDPEWSEGFSCRRSAAQKVGHIPGDFPVPFCRDYYLGLALKRGGFRKHVDLSISMEHVVPAHFLSYWRNRAWRGTFSAPHAFYFRKLPLPVIWLREGAKLCRSLAIHVLIVPAFYRAVRLAWHSPNRWRDFPGFLFVGLVQDAAMSVGNFMGLIAVVRARRRMPVALESLKS